MNPVVLAKFCVSVPGVLALLAVLFFISLGWPYGGEAAAWVQAIGSVIAILVAVWVASYQNNERLKDARNQREEFLHKILGVAKFATQIAVNAVRYGTPDNRDVNVVLRLSARLEHCEDLLKEVGFVRVPIANVALEWIELRHAVGDVSGVLRRSLSDPGFDSREYYDMDVAKDRALGAYKRMCNAAGVPEVGVFPT